MKKRVILAMSGGVDSSVAAYLLKQKGYSVIGLTFKIWPQSLCGTHGRKSCCSQEAINDARSVCTKLNIPHYVIDSEELFKRKVIDYFIRSYEKGFTPNPCIICNEKIKFPILLRKMRETDSDYIATGHHARSIFDRKSKRFLIKEAKDKDKDQSYVLFSITQDILSRLLLPAGDYKKEKIRAIAKELKLRVHQKSESQETCFIPDNNLGRFLREHLRKKIRQGVIIDKGGRVLGTHAGVPLFTIGQRRGLRIPFGRPLYVTNINYQANEIIVGEYRDTLRTSLTARDVNWAHNVDGTKPFSAEVKIRYRHPKTKASIKMLTSNSCQVNFLKPQSSPTPGQAVVFYNRETVLGGGWIV